MEYVVMLDRSAGNESVGEMWTETKIFPATATLADVEEWIRSKVNSFASEPTPFFCNVRLSTAQ